MEENKNARAGGQPGTGKSEKTNRPHYTNLWCQLQGIESCLLPLIVIVERVVREVTR